MKVLVSGFEPFGGREINNAWEVAKRFRSCTDIDVLMVPVSFERAHRVVEEAISKTHYDLVVMLGETSFILDKVRLERIAINYKDSEKPDNDGMTAYDEPLVDGAPAAYFTKFPVKRICSSLIDKEFSVKVTNSTGTFVCNSLYYNILHYLSQNSIPVTTLFVHLPASTEFVPFEEMTNMIKELIKTYNTGSY